MTFGGHLNKEVASWLKVAQVLRIRDKGAGPAREFVLAQAGEPPRHQEGGPMAHPLQLRLRLEDTR